TGAAAGMAAGAATEMLGGTPQQVSDAVAIAQQGTLGLVCDPLGGLVELPCVFRNATGSAIALAAVEMALAGITFAIPADEVIDTMGEIGREMDVRYRETAGGGLAATPTGRRLARERLVPIKRGCDVPYPGRAPIRPIGFHLTRLRGRPAPRPPGPPPETRA